MKYVQSAFTYLQCPPVPTPEFSLYLLDIWGGGGTSKALMWDSYIDIMGGGRNFDSLYHKMKVFLLLLILL